MNKLSRIFLALVVLAIVANGQSSETVTGYVTDTLCGKKGANARHVDCAKRSVAAGTAQYALYDEETRRLTRMAHSLRRVAQGLDAGNSLSFAGC